MLQMLRQKFRICCIMDYRYGNLPINKHAKLNIAPNCTICYSKYKICFDIRKSRKCLRSLDISINMIDILQSDYVTIISSCLSSNIFKSCVISFLNNEEIFHCMRNCIGTQTISLSMIYLTWRGMHKRYNKEISSRFSDFAKIFVLQRHSDIEILGKHIAPEIILYAQHLLIPHINTSKHTFRKLSSPKNTV